MPYLIHTVDNHYLSSVERAGYETEPILEYIGERGKSNLQPEQVYESYATADQIRHLLHRYVQHSGHHFDYRSINDVTKAFDALVALQDLGVHRPEHFVEKIFADGIDLQLLDQAILQYKERVPFIDLVIQFAY
jgi:hypothetical protein